MKRVSGFFLSAILTLFFTVQGFAQSEVAKENKDVKQATTSYGKFVDANKNGTCDNFEAHGNQPGRGRDFVDGNGDGICDRRASGTRGKGNLDCSRGRGGKGRKGMGYRQRPGCEGRYGNRQVPDKK